MANEKQIEEAALTDAEWAQIRQIYTQEFNPGGLRMIINGVLGKRAAALASRGCREEISALQRMSERELAKREWRKFFNLS